MTWKKFVSRWRPVVLTRLGIPARTVYAWREGSKEPPEGWQREAAQFWIEAKAGEVEEKRPAKKSAGGRKSAGSTPAPGKKEPAEVVEKPLVNPVFKNFVGFLGRSKK